MKNIFKEYYPYTEDELKEICKNALFVLDTNILLNMYRYSSNTKNKCLSILQELQKSNQLWIPYQVGYEFYQNRLKVIIDYKKSYKELKDEIDKKAISFKNSITEKLKKYHKEHLLPQQNSIDLELDKSLKAIKKFINKEEEKHPDYLEDDTILKDIETLFLDRIGKEFSKKELKNIQIEGEERYKNKIPPGFEDRKKKKGEYSKYGDLIIWKQIINKAEEIKKDIIFISDDLKEDWLLRKESKTIMPLPQLKKEIFNKAKVNFHIYNTNNFLLHCDENTPGDILKEVEGIRSQERELYLEMDRFHMINKMRDSERHLLHRKYVDILYKLNKALFYNKYRRENEIIFVVLTPVMLFLTYNPLIFD